MHLGGIGTGNVEIGADGQFGNWQLFNNLRDGTVPFHFAVRVGETARLLQTAGGPNWPRIDRIEMTGEYPVAALRFKDPSLPVELELEAFTPFAPLDSAASSWPLTIFRFRIRNSSATPQTVSLAAMMPNPVGYDAIGAIQGCSHPNFAANINESFEIERARGLFFRAQAGAHAVVDRPVTIYLLKDIFVLPPDPGIDNKNYAFTLPEDIAIPPLDRPKGLRVETLGATFSAAHLKQPAGSVIWLDEAPVHFPESYWPEIRSAVAAGAMLVFSGGTMPLLDAYGAGGGDRQAIDGADRPDILFEDFENGYGKWTVVGNAFGTEPAHGTLPNQQAVTGFTGHGLVNSYVNGDDATGKLISREFAIERNFIRFLIGGGHYQETQVRLVIDGRVVRATSGEDNEQLKPAVWNVKEFAGRPAHIEIVDNQKGGWGHINADEIVFSDRSLSASAMRALGELLPIRFDAIELETPAAPDGVARVNFQNVRLVSGATKTNADNGVEQFARTVGDGRVVLFAGQILHPARTNSSRERQKAYAWLCSLTGAAYTMTVGQSAKEPGFGTMALAALAGVVTGLTGYEDWDEAWTQFRENGRFAPLEPGLASAPTLPGKTTQGAIASTITVPAGGVVEVPFLLTWHYPNKYAPAGEWIGCHYATRWPNALKSALAAIFKYNWKSDLTGWKHFPRAFAGAGDKGLIVCTWPNGGRPARALDYSDEVWTGIEYQVAAHMIYEGMASEGLSIARGARERYDGVPRAPILRNPWCEIECGGHYTRAMSSWSLLLALSGFEYDGPRGRLRFSPRCQPENFKSFYSTAEGWGTFSQKAGGKTQKTTLAVLAGRVWLKAFQIGVPSGQAITDVRLGAEKVNVNYSIDAGQCHIHFGEGGIVVKPGLNLDVTTG
jgi:hypothetical protein